MDSIELAAQRQSGPMEPCSNMAYTSLSAPGLQVLLNEVEVGVMVCQEGGRLLWANSAAKRELLAAKVITLKPGDRLVCGQGEGAAPLTSALRKAAQGRRQLVSLQQGHHRLMLSMQPFNEPGTASSHVLVLMGRRQMAPDLVVEMLCSMHALTGAEQRILRGLLDGHGVDELADSYGVKISTVRTQVASLRLKLGVRRIGDALRMAAELPPMASALHRQAEHWMTSAR
jgi:DNA-binding CsgD family transcriptional regulator